MPNDKQSRQITTSQIGISSTGYRAVNHTVIYGEQGTGVDANAIHGNLEPHSNCGKEVTKNNGHSHNIVVPHMDQQTKEQFKKNADWAASFFRSASATSREGSQSVPDLKEKPDHHVTHHSHKNHHPTEETESAEVDHPAATKKSSVVLSNGKGSS